MKKPDALPGPLLFPSGLILTSSVKSFRGRGVPQGLKPLSLDAAERPRLKPWRTQKQVRRQRQKAEATAKADSFATLRNDKGRRYE
jgi:hypothetical protein